jgi:heat shock protein HslJ
MNITNIMDTTNIKKVFALVAVFAVAGFFLLGNYVFNKNGAQKDPKNTTYTIDGHAITLKDGVAEKGSLFSSSKTTARYFGNEVKIDLNNDGREDVAFLLTQETGGSGTFYYVVAALNMENGYIGSNAFFLGDRIAPQTTGKNGKVVIVNYADRTPGESFAIKPSVGKSIGLLLDAEKLQFNEVAINFNGNPSKLTLSGKTWAWIKTSYNDGAEITPLKPKIFDIVFWSSGSFAVATDCNSVGGRYTAKGGQISFSNIIHGSRKVCAGSQESKFTEMLINATSYHFTTLGELVLDLKSGTGSVFFR